MNVPILIIWKKIFYFIKFPKTVEKKRAELKPIMEDARKHGHHADLVKDKLYIDNCLYNPNDEETHHTDTNHKTMKDTSDYKRSHGGEDRHKPTHSQHSNNVKFF